jgi:hypothetical protein
LFDIYVQAEAGDGKTRPDVVNLLVKCGELSPEDKGDVVEVGLHEEITSLESPTKFILPRLKFPE